MGVGEWVGLRDKGEHLGVSPKGSSLSNPRSWGKNLGFSLISHTLVHNAHVMGLIRFAGDDISINLTDPCDQSDSCLASVTSYKAN